MARSFYAESRRVRNDRIKRELGVVLRYPTYREGLRAIAALRLSSSTVAIRRAMSAGVLRRWSPPLIKVVITSGASRCCGDLQRIFPRHVGIALAVQQPHRTGQRELLVEQQMVAPLLDQLPGEDRRLGRILRRAAPACRRVRAIARSSGDSPLSSMRSVKSGAAAISTSPARRSGRARATSSDSQPPMLEPTSTSLPVVSGIDGRQRIVEPAADRAVLEAAGRLAVTEIVEAQEGAAGSRAAHASSATALVPVMSERKPPRNTTVGARPSVFA